MDNAPAHPFETCWRVELTRLPDGRLVARLHGEDSPTPVTVRLQWSDDGVNFREEER